MKAQLKAFPFFSTIMQKAQISPSELDFITTGIAANIRADGRSRTDLRQIILETNIINQASGSCRCMLDNTDVLVGIKVEIGSIDAPAERQGDDDDDNELETSGAGDDGRNRGRVVCNVDCSPSASRFFDDRYIQDLCVEYSQYMNRLLNGPQGGIDLKSLCIIPNTTCWVIYIDALILNYDGNLLDTILIATRGALQNTRIAKCVVEEAGGKFEFDVADEETEYVQGWRDMPICITACKIGSRFIIDASPLEDLCAEARVMVAINCKGQLCSVQKDGFGKVQPTLLAEMIQTAQKIGKSTITKLDSILANEEARVEAMQKCVGFL